MFSRYYDGDTVGRPSFSLTLDVVFFVLGVGFLLVFLLVFLGSKFNDYVRGSDLEGATVPPQPLWLTSEQSFVDGSNAVATSSLVLGDSSVPTAYASLPSGTSTNVTGTDAVVDSSTYKATVIDYERLSAVESVFLSSGTDDGEVRKYGIERPVDVVRTARLGYARNLLGYKRKDEIYVPDISKDSKVCDKWMGTTTNGGYVQNLVSCDKTKGVDACFRCIESRKYVRSCVHIERDVTVIRDDGSSAIVPASGPTANDGWCLPQSFNDIIYDGGAVKPPPDKTRNCNPNTGDWFLAQLGQDDGSFDSSYNWICKCRYPNLMTNDGTLMSDCVKPVGCLPHGRLDDSSAKGLVDPYNKGSCVCDAGYKNDFDASVGPVCVELNIVDYGMDAVYKRLNENNFDILPVSEISTVFLTLFPPAAQPNLQLPDPCRLDSVTGTPVTGCKRATYTGKDKTNRVMCISIDKSHIAHVVETDYLLNNHGRLPNACLYTGSNDYNYQVPDTKETLEGQYMLSWYNGKSFPDVGLISSLLWNAVKPSAAVLAADKALRDDQRWNDFLKNECTASLASPGVKVRFDQDFFLSSTQSIVFYNEYPDPVDMFTMAEADLNVPFHSIIFGDLVRSDKVKLDMVSDKDLRHWREIQFVRVDRLYWFEQTVYWYNRWAANMDGSGCTGLGRILPGEAVYLIHVDRSSDVQKQPRKGEQWFLTGNSRYYPAIRSYNSCTIFQDWQNECVGPHDSEDGKYRWLAAIRPTVTYKDNRILGAYPRSLGFDCTVCHYITTNFYIMSTNNYCSNYKDYQKHTDLFEIPPDGVKEYKKDTK